MSEDTKQYNAGGNIRSVMTILPELRAGQLITELSAAIHDAVAAVTQHNKSATVLLKVTIAPSEKNDRLVEPVLIVTGEVESKLPKEVPQATVFFVDADGNPSRQAEKRQPDLGFSIASSQTQS